MQYRVGDYVLDLRKFELRQDDRLLAAEPQVLSLLFLLIENRDRLVSKDELVATIWDGRAVSDSAISSRIKSARQLLGDNGEAQRLIRTVHGKGFRFVGEVSVGEPETGDRNGAKPTAALPFGSDNPRLSIISNEFDQQPYPSWLAKTTAEPARRGILISITVGALLVTGMLAWHFWRDVAPGTSVAITSASTSADSEALARDVTAKLAMLGSVSEGSARVLDRTSREISDLQFEIATSSDGPDLETNLVLLSDKGELLWSKDFRQPRSKLSDLKQQLAFTAGKVLECALETVARKRPRLDRQTIKLYLNGCAAYADVNANNLAEIAGIFRRVTDAAPAFQPGWKKLLLVDAQALDYFDRTEFDSVRAAQAVAAARRVNPELPEIYLVLAETAPASAMTDRMHFIEEAARRAPTDADVALFHALYLVRVGRLHDAVDEARKSVRIDPLSPANREMSVIALGTAGRIAEAQQELRQADLLWPGAMTLREARYTLYLRFADPNEAIRLRDSGLLMPPMSPFQGSFLAARSSPTPANVNLALRDARALYNRNPIAIAHLSQTLGAFSRDEELFPILLNWQYPDKIDEVTDVLFRPALRNFRRDPRFMRVSKRLGLLNYWQTSGKWPDFCFDSDVPYDCKFEAAKIDSDRT